jgi:hypothetical protein
VHSAFRISPAAAVPRWSKEAHATRGPRSNGESTLMLGQRLGEQVRCHQKRTSANSRTHGTGTCSGCALPDIPVWARVVPAAIYPKCDSQLSGPANPELTRRNGLAAPDAIACTHAGASGARRTSCTAHALGAVRSHTASPSGRSDPVDAVSVCAAGSMARARQLVGAAAVPRASVHARARHRGVLFGAPARSKSEDHRSGYIL